MNHDLIASASIDITASPSQVWAALTQAELIKQYLYGTEAIGEWEPGKEIIFQGEYDGQQYRDKGLVRESRPGAYLSYHYWSNFSGLADIPENYCLVSYELKEKENGITTLTWTQKGFPDETRRDHTANGLAAILANIKAIVEIPPAA